MIFTSNIYAQNVELLKTLSFSNTPYRISFSPNGKYVVVSDASDHLKIYSVPDLKIIKELNVSGVFYACFSKDSDFLASLTTNRTVRIHSLPAFTLIKTFTFPSTIKLQIEFSDNGKLFEVYSFMMEKLYTLPEYDLIKTTVLGLFTDPSISDYSPNNIYFAKYFNTAKKVSIYSLSKKKYIERLDFQSKYVREVFFSPGGKYLVITSEREKTQEELQSLSESRTLETRTASIYSLPEFTLFKTIKDIFGLDNSATFSPNGKYFACISASDHMIRFYSTHDFSLIKALTDYSDSIISIAFSGDSRYVASGGQDKKLNLYQIIPI